MVSSQIIRTLLFVSFSAAALLGQGNLIQSVISKTAGKPNLAVVDFRGTGAAQPLMNTFNGTLYSDLETSGLFTMVSKSFYPLQNPQRPDDLKPTSGQGMALADWAGTPVNANWLAFGYNSVQGGQLVLYGYLYDTSQKTAENAQAIGKRYFGSVDDGGARKVAHEFAADIISKFGGGSLIGSHIYFVRETGRVKEIWQMDYDGQNQKALTHSGSLSIMPAVSNDGSKLAYTSFASGTPKLSILSTESGRPLRFYNQEASLNATPSFSPDGATVYYSSSASGLPQIYAANLDGTNFRRVSVSKAIQVEPKVNPKGGVIAFVAGPGHQQIYRMNLEGADVERLTNGEGEASNPSWAPDGRLLLFAWTRGYSTGAFNIFLMDPSTREFDQLTSNAGRNENPSWAPDGRHIVFTSNRSGSFQIYSMLADGTQLQRLTSSGVNRSPVWGK